MNHHMQPIIQHLFQVSSLEDVSRQRLESFVQEYPSFGIGHYLLSRKLRAEGAEEYGVEVQKANLYFTNPFWLQWLLENSAEPLAAKGVDREGQVADRVAPPVVVGETPAAEAGVPVAEAVEVGVPMAEEAKVSVPVEDAGQTEGVRPVEEEPRAEVMVPAEAPEVAGAGQTEGAGQAEGAVIGEEVVAEEGAVPTEPLMERVKDEPVAELVKEELGWVEKPAEPVAAAPEGPVVQGSSGSSAAELLLESLREARGLRESLVKMNEDLNADRPIVAEAGLAPETVSAASAGFVEEPIKDEETPFVLDEEEVPVAAGAAEASEGGGDEETSAGGAVDGAAGGAVTHAMSMVEPDLVFEPYHTIDYFASQGIKLTLEENPSDQLGKQLKSFTDWLKMMRRLPQKEREMVPDRVAEQTVQTIAAHSVVGREVVTETMAEVLAKQGMPERARAMYEKLSLLNPDKRAYFATKIEQLNSH
jgi:hypothetical protein